MLTHKIWKVAVSLSFLKKLIQTPTIKLEKISYSYSKYENKDRTGFQRSSGSGGTFLGKIMNDNKFKYQKKGNLSDYLNEYLSKLEKGSYILLDYVQICKSIAHYYTKEKHQQFIRQRVELQKMVDTFSSLQTGEPSLEEHFVLMDFLKTMEDIEPINKKITNTLKDILFSKINPVLQKLDDIKFQDLLKLYCKISLLNSPQTQRIGKFLQEKIQKKQLNQERIANAAETEKVLKSFGERKFLYHFDNNIIKLLVMDLKGNIQPTDKLLILKIANAINSCNVIGNMADSQFLSIVKQIINKATQIIQERYNPEFVNYFLQKDCSGGRAFSTIYQTIYKYLLEKIAVGDKNPKLLKQFCSVLEKRKNHLYSIEDIKLVIQYIRTSFQNEAIKSVVFKQQSMELIVIEMMKNGFFDANLALLNEIMVLPKVEIYWNFCVQYSIRNVPFPIDQLAKKIKPKTGLFSMDSNYMKVAVSISCQHKLYPKDQMLLKSHENIANSIKSQKWSNQHWVWLLKQSVTNMKMSKMYFRQYSQALMMHSNIKNQPNNIFKEKNNNQMSFWKYFLTVAEINKQNELLLESMPIETIQAVSFREVSKPNQETIINCLLLKAIIYNIKSQRLNLQKMTTRAMLFLLKLYSEKINQERELTVELYLNVVTQLVVYLPKIPTQNQIYVKAIILRSVNIQSPMIYNSIYYRVFMSQLLKQLEYFSKGSFQKDLVISIIRRGLQHKLVSAKNLISINIEDNYFTELEKNLLKAIKNQYKNQTVSYSSLIAYLIQAKKEQPSIQLLNAFYQIIESSSLRSLQRLILYYPQIDKIKNNPLLIKICQKLGQKLQFGEVDIIGVLKSIFRQNIDLEAKIFSIIIHKLALKPSSIFLRDHLEIIKLLKQRKRKYPQYYQSLLKQFVEKSEQNPTIIDIALELKSQVTTFSKQLIELMKQIANKHNKYETKVKKLQT